MIFAHQLKGFFFKDLTEKDQMIFKKKVWNKFEHTVLIKMFFFEFFFFRIFQLNFYSISSIRILLVLLSSIGILLQLPLQFLLEFLLLQFY